MSRRPIGAGLNALPHLIWLVIFFFQAEDGIRDYKVTGVQTCALPISERAHDVRHQSQAGIVQWIARSQAFELRKPAQRIAVQDRKSTRLNSSHLVISYAVFCLKKKKKQYRCKQTIYIRQSLAWKRRYG